MKCVNDTLAAQGADYLSYFNPTAAALDVMHAIDANANPGEKAYIYGVSYGTYWTNRYLLIAPQQSSGVVVDGICSSNMCRIQTYDADLDTVGGDLLALCDADAGCNQNLRGRSARRMMEETFASLDDGTLRCANDPLKGYNLTRALTGQILATALGRWELRVLVVPIIWRLARCSASDVTELVHFFNELMVPLVHSPMTRPVITSSLTSVAPASVTVNLTAQPLPQLGSNFLGNNILMRCV
jgi:hypothetical protein